MQEVPLVRVVAEGPQAVADQGPCGLRPPATSRPTSIGANGANGANGAKGANGVDGAAGHVYEAAAGDKRRQNSSRGVRGIGRRRG